MHCRDWVNLMSQWQSASLSANEYNHQAFILMDFGLVLVTNTDKTNLSLCDWRIQECASRSVWSPQLAAVKLK